MSRTYSFSLPIAISVAYLFFAAPGAMQLPTPTEPVLGNLRLTVLVTGPDRKQVPSKDAVAWIPGLMEPSRPGTVSRLKISSKDKRFEPRISAVSVGSTVVFPNYDRIFHNVFSLSETAKFDLGLYRNGDSRSFTFKNPGLVQVYCNIHAQMSAYLMVVPSQVFGLAEKNGVIHLDALPAGRHPLRVWEERGGEWTGTIRVDGDKTTEVPIVFDAAAWRQTPHKNKYGKDYPPPDDDENRY